MPDTCFPTSGSPLHHLQSPVRRWLLVQACAYTAHSLWFFAECWWIYLATSSAFNLGLIDLFCLGPLLVIGPMAAKWVDRQGPTRVLLVTQTCALLFLTVLLSSYFWGLSVSLLLVMAAFKGLFFAVDTPARRAMLFRVVGGSPSELQMVAPALMLSHILAECVGALLAATFLQFGSVYYAFLLALGLSLPMVLSLGYFNRIAEGHQRAESVKGTTDLSTWRAASQWLLSARGLQRNFVQLGLFAVSVEVLPLLLAALLGVAGQGIWSAGVCILLGIPGALLAQKVIKHPYIAARPRQTSLACFIGAAIFCSGMTVLSTKASLYALWVLLPALRVAGKGLLMADSMAITPASLQGRMGALHSVVESVTPAVMVLALSALFSGPELKVAVAAVCSVSAIGLLWLLCTNKSAKVVL